MVVIDLMLVLKPLSDVGKMCSVTTNIIGIHVGF